MAPLPKFLVAVLAAGCGVASAGTYTFQTSPAGGDFLQTDAGLAVRWENREGNSPDSPSVPTPPMVTVSLGYRSGQNPVVLYPPISGPTSNVPTASGSWIWERMDFSNFINGPAPARDMNTDWFIRLADQSSGYVSNGQLFKLIEGSPSGNSNSSAKPPAANTSPADKPAPPPANSKPQPAANSPGASATPASSPAAAVSNAADNSAGKSASQTAAKAASGDSLAAHATIPVFFVTAAVGAVIL